MHTYKIENDLSLLGVQASSFPQGIRQAWAELHKKLSTPTGRNFYGLSHGTSDGRIIYKACVEEAFDGEAKSLHCQRFVLPKGDYIGTKVQNYWQHLSKIGETFQALLARDDYDKVNGQCVEKYVSETEVICMIKKAAPTR